jgi:major membrane immunogen (membrane-anchored lipoprotein)
MKKISILLFACSFLFSCSKSNTSVYGKVTDKSTGVPRGGELIELYTGQVNSVKNRALKNSTRTWSDGTYEFDYRSSIFDGNIWVECNGIQSDYIKKKQKNEVNLTIH